MSETVIVALIGLAGSSIGSLLGILVSSKLTQYRLEQLEKKFDAALSEISLIKQRIYELEKHNEVQDERQKVANNRIDDLEKKVFS